MGMLLLMVLMIPLLAVILDSSIARAIAKRLEGGAGGLPPDEARRLRSLEGEVDRLSEEVTRLQEQGEFLERLLDERAAPDALPPGNAHGDPPGDGPR